ncbi:SUMF1/EgtB/PvdO family nonheme iron enzyme [Flammeovirga pacifica]|uniref:Sulfatase-modifying factor enzyme-like domain-containing protein n=1 Tax=Flammeovirga pacifica TaxID=915059 RepID=A0A1S1Z227_FLAPC|nr:SUMF1/EgtB/PvdO family nonheme iron enzyme [Flammeovirga pacifica]OHX67292.1 hypothetical protein NH26_13545 [Flammeovirga pacifica]
MFNHSHYYLKISTLFITLFLLTNQLVGNNVRISNLSYGEKNLTEKSLIVNLTLEWDNSWKVTSGPANWDAVWVFAKFRDNNGQWKHVKFNYDIDMNHGHTELNDKATIDLSNDDGLGNAHGLFIHSKTDITQQSVLYDLGLKWNYGASGMTNDDTLNIRFFAIEMVYVPEAPFELGSTGGENGHFYKFNGTNTTDSYTVSNEDEISIGNTVGDLWYDIIDSTSLYKQGDQLGPVPAEFPKGYNAFYCMKYEITQGQFAGLLSSIDGSLADSLLIRKVKVRNNITTVDDSVFTAAEPYIPVQYLSWKGLASFLDWAALRPFTELEFEKACRGTAAPVANEYVWGNNNIIQDTTLKYSFTNEGTNNEQVASNFSNSNGNAIYKITTITNQRTPYRYGILSAYPVSGSSSITRVEAGATFYGIMEMGGNVEERVITVGRPQGRAYTGLHGDGELDANGRANVSFWPDNTDAIGVGIKGSAYNKNKGRMRISNRVSAAFTIKGEKAHIGGRGCRTAPSN